MKVYTLEQITEIIGGMLNKVGDGIQVKKISPPKLADENTLALALSEDEIQNLPQSNAKAALVPLGVSFENISTIEVERPKLAMMKLIHLFYIPPDASVGVHPSAVIHPTAKLGKGVSIGPNVVIGRDVEIGDNTKILANAYIGKETKIKNDCLFHPGVNIGDFIQIGERVIIHHGASIGADGFSFVTETPSRVEDAKEKGEAESGANYSQQKTYKIPSIGSVVINNDVEIGANATIDRGTIENTIIGQGTKIDNLVMVSHNCKIGENCLIISQVGIAGSTVIGDRVVLAGQVGVADHLTVGNDAIAMAKSGITKSIPEKSIVFGTPAIPRKQFIKQTKYLKEMETLVKEFKQYKAQIDEFLGSKED